MRPYQLKIKIPATIFLIIHAMTYGCATIPDGELQLGPKIIKDMKESRVGTVSLSKGRPLYIEARSYPQLLESGDIWAGGPVMVNIGREDLSFDAILDGQAADHDEAGSAKGAISRKSEGGKP